MIQVDLTTTTGARETRIQKDARTSITFEATVEGRHHVRVTMNEQGAIIITHAAWVTVGDRAQWAVQDQIIGG